MSAFSAFTYRSPAAMRLEAPVYAGGIIPAKLSPASTEDVKS
jgi:hypothetical protein